MTGGMRITRHSFNFYLFISLASHLVIMVFFSTVQFPALEEKSRDVIPVKIQTRKPVQSAGPGHRETKFMTPGKLAGEPVISSALRRSTRLPDFFHRAPRPPSTTREPQIRAVAGKFSGISLGEEFKPGLKDRVLSKKIETTQKISENIENTYSSSKKRAEKELKVTPRKNDSNFMSLGVEQSQETVEPQIKSRPSFPFGSLHKLLPPSRVKVIFSLEINGKGQVSEVSVVEGSGNDKLDENIMDWVKRWKYESMKTSVKTEVSVEIPGE